VKTPLLLIAALPLVVTACGGATPGREDLSAFEPPKAEGPVEGVRTVFVLDDVPT